MSDVTAAANSDGVAMGDDDYVILNGDLSFYAPPPAGCDPTAGVGLPGRCAPWLGTLNPDERAVFVELDRSLRDRYDVITCTVQATPSATGSRRHHKVRQPQGQHCSKIMKSPQSLPLQMAERLLRPQPDSVANHVTARSISD